MNVMGFLLHFYNYWIDKIEERAKETEASKMNTKDGTSYTKYSVATVQNRVGYVSQNAGCFSYKELKKNKEGFVVRALVAYTEEANLSKDPFLRKKEPAGADDPQNKGEKPSPPEPSALKKRGRPRKDSEVQKPPPKKRASQCAEQDADNVCIEDDEDESEEEFYKSLKEEEEEEERKLKKTTLFTVDLDKKKRESRQGVCECLVFFHTGIPCIHMIYLILSQNGNPLSYISDRFSLSNHEEMYKEIPAHITLEEVMAKASEMGKEEEEIRRPKYRKMFKRKRSHVKSNLISGIGNKIGVNHNASYDIQPPKIEEFHPLKEKSSAQPKEVQHRSVERRIGSEEPCETM